jgi:hypothetical protein
VQIELDNYVGGIVSSEHEPVGEQELKVATKKINADQSSISSDNN